MDAAIAELEQTRREHARQVAEAGGVEQALGSRIDTTVSEALVLGLLLQGIKTFFSVFGHGSTEIGEVLRIYQDAGLLRVCGVRSEIEASHAATALRWVTGERRRSSPRSGRARYRRWPLRLPRAQMVWGFGTCWATRRPKTRGRICSRFPARSRMLFCGSSEPWGGRIRCTRRWL